MEKQYRLKKDFLKTVGFKTYFNHQLIHELMLTVCTPDNVQNYLYRFLSSIDEDGFINIEHKEWIDDVLDFGLTNKLIVKTKKVTKLDFAQVYANYPKRGFEFAGYNVLTKTVKSQEDYELLLVAVNNYKNHVLDNCIETMYIKNFNNWCKVWTEWVDVQDSSSMYEQNLLESLKDDR